MQKLNRVKPFGKISGETFIPDGCDRPAHYEQDGLFFDAHDRAIVAGQAVAAVDAGADDGTAIPADMTVAQLLLESELMPWRKFVRYAQHVLGPECPQAKMAIIEKLHEVQREFDARAAARKGGRPRKAAAQDAQSAKAAVKESAPASGVDLAAWARGQREYLWGDVRKAIRATYSRSVQERHDAVEMLITEGVITADEARKDVFSAA